MRVGLSYQKWRFWSKSLSYLGFNDTRLSAATKLLSRNKTVPRAGRGRWGAATIPSHHDTFLTGRRLRCERTQVTAQCDKSGRTIGRPANFWAIGTDRFRAIQGGIFKSLNSSDIRRSVPEFIRLSSSPSFHRTTKLQPSRLFS